MPADGDVGTRATAVLRAAMPVSSGNLGLGMRTPVPAERDQDNRDGRPGRRPSKDSERSQRIANNDSSNTGESHIEARESGHDGCNVESVADSWTAQRSTIVRNRNRRKSASRVQMWLTPCSRIGTAACRSCITFPRRSGSSGSVCARTAE